MTRAEAFAYLRAERRDLADHRHRLHREFQALHAAKFPPQRCAAYRQQVLEYWSRRTNHWLAFEWTLHPPVGREWVVATLRLAHHRMTSLLTATAGSHPRIAVATVGEFSKQTGQRSFGAPMRTNGSLNAPTSALRMSGHLPSDSQTETQ